jgi:NAD(P)-dependent dehydrogenase (short-subunit alcohol dehydrogenase family)
MGLDLDGRTCVVTGAAGGIGLACARAFTAQGARVVASDRDADRLALVAAEHDLVAVPADVGSEAGVVELIEAVETSVGPIDLFMSNAGVAVGMGLDASDADWDLSWRVNTMAHVWAARHLVPRMRERGSGYLVSTASAAGLLMEPSSAPYTLTKHAAVAFAEWLAVNHGDVIGVSVLCPQGVRTAMLDSVSGDSGTVTLADGVLEPEQVAAAVVVAVREGRFLISPHDQVHRYEAGKVADRDRWITGMRRVVFGR